MITKALDLSTGNMPNPHEPDFAGYGDLRHLEDEHSVVVFVYPGLDSDRIPKWLRVIHAYAAAMECTVIVFDPDGDLDGGFATYEW